MKPFQQQMALMRFGALNEELDSALSDLLAKVNETGRVGEISLTLKFKKNGEKQIEVFDAVKVKMPQAPRESSVLFISGDGQSLQREHPDQRTLTGLKSADEVGDPRPLKAVG